MAESEKKESKLIIDEDWKSQVEAEKERLERERAASASAREEPQKETNGAAAAAPTSAADHPMPPASFDSLVSMLATPAFLALGQFPDPQTGKTTVMLNQAKHFIDTLQLLQDKTKGNLTDRESQILENVLHELRMSYVTQSSKA